MSITLGPGCGGTLTIAMERQAQAGAVLPSARRRWLTASCFLLGFEPPSLDATLGRYAMRPTMRFPWEGVEGGAPAEGFFGRVRRLLGGEPAAAKL